METDYITLNIAISKKTMTHLLGGLAEKYRALDIYSDIQRPIKVEIENLIQYILRQMHRRGIDIMQPRSPFNTYAKLIEFKPDLYDKDQLAK